MLFILLMGWRLLHPDEPCNVNTEEVHPITAEVQMGIALLEMFVVAALNNNGLNTNGVGLIAVSNVVVNEDQQVVFILNCL